MTEVTTTNQRILYVTGRGGRLDKGLAAHLSTIVDDFKGIAIDVEFLRQPPLDQVAQIHEKLRTDPTRIVIANSYGAYLTLQALVDLDQTLEHVVLLSPVLGVAMAKDRLYMSRPPLTGRLKRALEEGRVCMPQRMQIIVGDEDELYSPAQFDTVSDYFGSHVLTVLQGEGHSLSRPAMKSVLQEILTTKG